MYALFEGHHVQKRCPHACTCHQRGGALVTALPGGEKNDRICPASYVQKALIWDRWCGPATLAHILCKTPADISWLPGGTCTSCPAALLQLPAHHEPAEQHFSDACPPQCVLQLRCPSSHTILGLTLSGTECFLPRSPDPVHIVLDVSSVDLYIWASHLTVLYNSCQTQAFPGHSSSHPPTCFRAFLKL